MTCLPISLAALFLHIVSPLQDDLRLSGPLSGMGAGGGARIRDRRVPEDLRTDSLTPVPPTLLSEMINPDHSLSLQQGDLRLSGPPSGQGTGDGARTRDRMVPADLRADSLATVLPT
ncbi:hypothetical protein PoB_000764400 [Plakobranchus ocellatus]|uniref:Uncharacterized protein n=1 Tax=Plakobranchus ocellatus TaxID=259542 RepID=A0AAV3YFQ8_9GAST|nr:hypothetical protein PoB_000764400 [Plakobranchus ocellatus]